MEVRAKSTIKITHVNGSSSVDFHIKKGNDLLQGLNSMLHFAGINGKKFVLVDTEEK